MFPLYTLIYASPCSEVNLQGELNANPEECTRRVEFQYCLLQRLFSAWHSYMKLRRWRP